MAQSCYDPDEAVRFWGRMQNLAEGQPPQFLSTHPSHQARQKHLEEWWVYKCRTSFSITNGATGFPRRSTSSRHPTARRRCTTVQLLPTPQYDCRRLTCLQPMNSRRRSLRSGGKETPLYWLPTARSDRGQWCHGDRRRRRECQPASKLLQRSATAAGASVEN